MSSRPSKRVRLEELEDSEDNCSICLHSFKDRTLIPTCSHEFCFECLLVWAEQSRRCPLCSAHIGDHLIHKFRSKHDYEKRYLPPLATNSPKPLAPMSVTGARPRGIRTRERRWGRQESEEADKLERSIRRRKYIYEHHLFAKHVASNSQTRFRPYPTPSQFSASQDLQSRTITFLRRELRVWVNLDVEFLTTFIISMMKSIDIRSESAVKLLSEFLDMDLPYVEGKRHPNAEHFAHELYSYVRSPYKDLFIYDTVVQYDKPESSTSTDPDSVSPQPQPGPSTSRISPPKPHLQRRSRSQSISHLHTPQHSPSASSPHSDVSWSPSGRKYPSAGRPRSPSPPPPRVHQMQTVGNGIEQKDVKGKGKSKANGIRMDGDSADEWVPELPPPPSPPAAPPPVQDPRQPQSVPLEDTSALPQWRSHHEHAEEKKKMTSPIRDRKKRLRAPRQVSLADSIRGHLSSHASIAVTGASVTMLDDVVVVPPRIGLADNHHPSEGVLENGISIRGAASQIGISNAALTSLNENSAKEDAPNIKKEKGELNGTDRSQGSSRELLLKKLVMEKKAVLASLNAPLPPSPPTRTWVSPPPSSPAVDVDMEKKKNGEAMEMEARLRTKARLKVKLAGEKRKLADA